MAREMRGTTKITFCFDFIEKINLLYFELFLGNFQWLLFKIITQNYSEALAITKFFNSNLYSYRNPVNIYLFKANNIETLTKGVQNSQS